MRFIDEIIEALTVREITEDTTEALVHAVYLFEKARGMERSGWTEEVLRTEFSASDVILLRQAVVEFVEQTGFGTFALSKCGDQNGLKSVYVKVMRRQLDGDPGELFQAMIALNNIGELRFPEGSASIAATDDNRAFAKLYLAKSTS